jgi:predicted hydrolase (HD superfamily)
MHPTAPRHPLKGGEILVARGVPPPVVYAILAHADYAGMPRLSLLDRALYACDELTGFVHACALVRPGRVIDGLEPPSVRKKLRDKAFPRTSQMAKALFAVDELTGLITATALVRPSKSVNEVDARSVRKKMKDKAFARGVNREDVINGAAELGVDLDEHIAFVISALTSVAPEIGLARA